MDTPWRHFYERLLKLKPDSIAVGRYGELISVPHTTMVAWERGSIIRIDYVWKIAEILGVDPGWLAFDSGLVPTDDQIEEIHERLLSQRAAS